MSRGQSRVNRIIEMVEAVRDRHFWLLAGPVRWEQLRKLLWELNIELHRAPILDEGWVIGQPGAYIIVIRNDLRGRRPTQVALHELGHVFLHLHDEHGAEHGVERHLAPCKAGDPREAEAELFARMLWYGRNAGPDNNAKIGEVAAAIIANAHQKRPTVPDPQLRLGLISGMPMYTSPAQPAGDQSHGSYNALAGESRRPRDRYKGPRLRVGDSHDSLLFDWSKAGKPLGYFHLQRGWCDIWDTMPNPFIENGRREILVAGDRRAQWRDFVFSTTERYRYVFREDEKRSRSPKDLNRQIERADRLAVQQPISASVLFRARDASGSSENSDKSERSE